MRTDEINSVVQTEPGTGRNFNLRAYLAGGAATAALIAAVIFVFGSLAAYVAFNGLPVGGENTATPNVVVDGGVGTATNAAGSTAASPSSSSTRASNTGGRSAGPGGGHGANASQNTGTGSGGTATVTPPGASTGDSPPATAPPAAGPSDPAPTSPTDDAPQVPSAVTGAVGGAVDDIEGAAHEAGIDVPLGQSSSGLTDLVDQVGTETHDGAGGVAGNDNLGDDVAGLANGLTGTLLGQD